MFEVESDVARAKPVVNRGPRVPGEFYASGCSVAPSTKPKVKPTRGNFKHNPHNTVERAPLSLDPLFRRFKGDSKAACIKDTGKRAGVRKVKLNPRRERGPAQTPAFVPADLA